MPVPERKPSLVPPHVAWPLFVVFLLSISLCAAVITVIATRSDGGVRLVTPAGQAQPAGRGQTEGGR